jgi:L-2-hydroxyglutarate oxidase
MGRPTETDILVVGAGVLGVTTAYWLSTLYDSKVLIVDRSPSAAMHMTSRNTGVLHRPFYLHPEKKRIFARTSDASYRMWKELAESGGLPWHQVGTLNVAVDESEIETLERYLSWGLENGMGSEELELVGADTARSLEPEVRCKAALRSKTDVSVDFAAFTRHLLEWMGSRGVSFLGDCLVTSVTEGPNGTEATVVGDGGSSSIHSRLMINAAGGDALRLAHDCGLGLEYTALNFRGEYWVVDEPFASRVATNVYRPPRQPEFPFLDPHFVVRADGSRQIGPGAVLVPGPYVYEGAGLTESLSLFARPLGPKAKLLMNREFLALLASEWRSSLSKKAMCSRVRSFVPGLDPRMLNERAVFGVRSSVVGPFGFVSEALLIRGPGSAHIVNFNSPGATGAPAYSAAVVEELRRSGQLDGFPRKGAKGVGKKWDFAGVVSELPTLGGP